MRKKKKEIPRKLKGNLKADEQQGAHSEEREQRHGELITTALWGRFPGNRAPTDSESPFEEDVRGRERR